jgi:integrase
VSIQRVKTGWKVRWTQDGRHRGRTFKLKADAEAWEGAVRRRKQLGPIAAQQLTDRGPTLGEWIAERWTPEHGSTLERRTILGYSAMYARHGAPWLDHLAIRALTVSVMRRWQAERLAAGVTIDQVLQTRTFLSSVLRHAAESEVIPANPILYVRAPRRPQRKEVRPLSPREIERVRAAMAGDLRPQVADASPTKRQRKAHTQPDQRTAHVKARDVALLSVLAYGGARPSEALAISWRHVGENTILIERSTDVDGSFKSTKARNSRSVHILSPLAQDLRALYLAAGSPPLDSLLFPRLDGSAWTKLDWDNWRRRTWRRACVASGLDPVPRVYDLRHSFISLLLVSRRSVHYVAKQAGHSPQMTLGRYGHVIEELERAESVDPETVILDARANAVAQILPSDVDDAA